MAADTENKTTMSHCTAVPAELPENCLEKIRDFERELNLSLIHISEPTRP